MRNWETPKAKGIVERLEASFTDTAAPSQPASPIPQLPPKPFMRHVIRIPSQTATHSPANPRQRRKKNRICKGTMNFLTPVNAPQKLVQNKIPKICRPLQQK